MASKSVTLEEKIGGSETTSFGKSLTLATTVGGTESPVADLTRPAAPKIEWPQGSPLFEVQWRAVAESLAGNGVIGRDALKVEATSNTLELSVASGSAFYMQSPASLSTTDLHTISGGDSTYDRWDTVAFDTVDETTIVREGFPDQHPEPPGVRGGELLLAVIHVPANATDITDRNILNWRAQFSNQASETYYDDPNNLYGTSNVAGALNANDLELVRSADNTITGQLADLPTNPGTFGSLFDAGVDSSPTAGTVQSYGFSLDATDLLSLTAEADGAGGIQNPRLPLAAPLSHLAQSSAPGFTGQGAEYYDTGDETPKYANAAGTYQRPLSRINVESFSTDESGTVKAGTAGVVYITGVEANTTIDIYQAGLLKEDGQPAPTGLDLVLVTLDNQGTATKQTTIIGGDGTVQDDVTASPITSYTTGSSAQTVGVYVDNGNFGSGTGSTQEIFATVKGEVLN